MTEKVLRELFGQSVVDAVIDGNQMSIRFGNDAILQVHAMTNFRESSVVLHHEIEYPMPDANAAYILKRTEGMTFEGAARLWKQEIEKQPSLVSQRAFADWAVANLVDLTNLRRSMENKGCV